MAAAAPASGSTWPAATSGFAAACGALSHYVRAAEAERAQAAPAVPVRRPLPLMPGADVGGQDPAAEAGPAPAQMTIVYGDQVLVLDGVPADKAAGLLRLATAAVRGGPAAADLPVARKASLQRFMEKRRGRAAARGAPYRRPAADDQQYLELAL
ncbi:hypothetical protein C2845_PM01G43900 [Panicum miliaceum]|uniref:Protein TIFY n=1 Tax=Panicum miliaceum TaxID=4540 RepID=A0A3L6TJW9_PANMI|nr:hypothetical protein C2845_PM01G43900 [Panicum miliaceum]